MRRVRKAIAVLYAVGPRSGDEQERAAAGDPPAPVFADRGRPLAAVLRGFTAPGETPGRVERRREQRLARRREVQIAIQIDHEQTVAVCLVEVPQRERPGPEDGAVWPPKARARDDGIGGAERQEVAVQR